MEVIFTDIEKVVFQKKLDLILTAISRYKSEQKKDDNYRFSSGPAEEGNLDRLEQAIKDQTNFFDSGRKIWFENYKNIIKNYRYGLGYTAVWNLIESDFYSFWKDLTIDEQFFVSALGSMFRIPNLKKTAYSQFEELMDTKFKGQLSELDEIYELETIKIADTYHLKIRAIMLENMYLITCTDAEVQVRITKGANAVVEAKVTRLLFDLVASYLN
jgi:hypothetical protein